MKQREYINPEDKADSSFFVMALVILAGIVWDKFVFAWVNYPVERTFVFLGVMLGVVFFFGLLGVWWWLLSEATCVFAFIASVIFRRALEDAMDISESDKP